MFFRFELGQFLLQFQKILFVLGIPGLGVIQFALQHVEHGIQPGLLFHGQAGPFPIRRRQAILDVRDPLAMMFELLPQRLDARPDFPGCQSHPFLQRLLTGNAPGFMEKHDT